MPYAAGMTRGSRARSRRTRTRSRVEWLASCTLKSAPSETSSRVEWLASCTLRSAPSKTRGRRGSRLLRAAESQVEAKGYGVVCQLVIAVESIGSTGDAVP